MNEKNKTRKIVIAAMMAAVTCVATMMITIPSPLKGYLNFGDCFVLIAGWMLSPVYGFLAAGLGSALADLFAGYVIYAPATFVIKGSMALIACCVFKLLQKKCNKMISRVTSGVLAELIMVLGYFVFEGFMYGFIPSAVNIPANAVQGIVGLVMGVLLIKVVFTLQKHLA